MNEIQKAMIAEINGWLADYSKVLKGYGEKKYALHLVKISADEVYKEGLRMDCEINQGMSKKEMIIEILLDSTFLSDL